MTKKLCDMTPSQLAQYHEQKKKNAVRMKSGYAARRRDPVWIAKNKAAQKKHNAVRSKRAEVKKQNADRMRLKYQNDPQYAERQKAYWASKRNDPGYKPIRLAKQREYGRRYKAEKRLNEEFAAFMSRIEVEAAYAEQGQ